ncbi:cellulose binding domain-containing protein [Streptosporangium sp. NPDC020072]|uniref:Cellulose binding domain-containing protein n=1 Tax=Streptosporangium jomthongense TaxID=1193683 RepID=A0ABV8FCP0_9ACTN
MPLAWKRRLTLACAALTLPLTATAVPAQAEAAGLAPLLVAGPTAVGGDHYIVVVKESATLSGELRASLERDAVVEGGQITHRYAKAIAGFAAVLPDDALDAVRANPAVAYVEPDSAISGQTVQPNPPSWGIDRVEQHNLPLDNSFTYTTTGAGSTAFIVDSGIRTTHTEFGGRASFGANFVEDGRTDDCHGHGTHVAGTVGGATYGMAKAVNLVAVRVLNCANSGLTSDLVAAMDWVALNHPARSVANFSLQGYGTAANDAAEGLIDSGVQTVFIANNYNTDACTNAPRSPRGIVVGATDITDQKATFSSYGTCVDVFAPGVSITSSVNTDDNASGSWSGTSMAAPHVTGWVARYLQDNPTATMADTKTALISSSTKNVLTNIGDGSPNRLLYAEPGTTPVEDVPPSTPGTPVASNLTSRTVTLTWTASTDNVGVIGYDLFTGSGQPVGTYPSASAALTGLSPNTTYTYYVRARDDAGNVSDPSGTVSLTTPADPGVGACKVTYNLASEWSNGFNADITYTNTSLNTVTGWTIAWSFSAGQHVNSGWNAVWGQNGANVTADNLTWNKTVAPGESVSVGISGSHTGTNPAPTAFTVNGSTCTVG